MIFFYAENGAILQLNWNELLLYLFNNVRVL